MAPRSTPKLGLFSVLILTLVVFLLLTLILNYFRLISISENIPLAASLPTQDYANPERLDLNSKTNRNLITRLFPYDPQSPMVTTLQMTYILTGNVRSFEKKDDKTWRLILNNAKDGVDLQIDINTDDNPQVSDAQNQTLTIDKIKPQYSATVSLLYDYKQKTQKVLTIHVNQ